MYPPCSTAQCADQHPAYHMPDTVQLVSACNCHSAPPACNLHVTPPPMPGIVSVFLFLQQYLSPEHAKAMSGNNSQGPVYKVYVSDVQAACSIVAPTFTHHAVIADSTSQLVMLCQRPALVVAADLPTAPPPQRLPTQLAQSYLLCAYHASHLLQLCRRADCILVCPAAVFGWAPA
jgi:hypothetical protein